MISVAGVPGVNTALTPGCQQPIHVVGRNHAAAEQENVVRLPRLEKPRTRATHVVRTGEQAEADRIDIFLHRRGDDQFLASRRMPV
jgi:hypothetical protein